MLCLSRFRDCGLIFPCPRLFSFSTLPESKFHQQIFDFFVFVFVLLAKMVSRLVIGDNNLSRFWAAFSFGRPGLKNSSLVTATDLDTFDHALAQVEDRHQVIISVLTSILLEEANSSDVSSSASNVCNEAVSRLVGVCPRTPGCQVRSFSLFVCHFMSSFLFDCFFRTGLWLRCLKWVS